MENVRAKPHVRNPKYHEIASVVSYFDQKQPRRLRLQRFCKSSFLTDKLITYSRSNNYKVNLEEAAKVLLSVITDCSM